MASNYIRDKDWMYMGRAERMQSVFVDGVGAFMDFARRHDMVRRGRLICPCKLCVNKLHQLEEEVELHIVKNGFVSDYITWVYHGEIEGLSDANEEEQEEDTLFPGEEMEDMVEVVLGDTNPIEDLPSGRGQREDNYDKYMNDAGRPIYEGAKHSMLSWFVHLFQIKCLNKWSNKSFTMLLKFLKDSMPPGNHVPESWYEAQKIMSNLGLNCEKIHACPNDCVLYWKENSNKIECPTCGEARYKKKVYGQKKGIPIKIVRYFPITQRLQRLFKCKKTAMAMTWHHRAHPSENGRMSHPRDTPAWKDFDNKHPTFSKEPRNIRLGLASDGFCPFSFKGNPHSTWPVVMMVYNLSPWLAMDQSYFMMPLLIDGPNSPGNNIDVYLRPLIEELRSLFIDGVQTYDADTGTTFTMRVALMWTINDFPAYGMLSGWSVHGYKACPYCHLETTSKRLPFSNKTCYCGHRRMLHENHPYRNDSVHFDGTTENRPRPSPLSGEDILSQWNGKNNVTFGKVKGRQETPQGWNKKSIFFELPYWKTNKVRHNLDVMHIEKGVSEHILNLLLCKDGKSKDNLKARRDLQAWNIRTELHPIPKVGNPDKFVLPNAVYHMSQDEKKRFLQVLHELKVPTGFSGSFSKKIKIVKGKIDGLKSHDHHVIMEHLLPLSLRSAIPNSVGLVINELCSFFRELCAKNIEDDKLEKLEAEIPLILCKLERIFPPSFFDIIIHLTVHLATEARLAGPVQYRWMYPVERCI